MLLTIPWQCTWSGMGPKHYVYNPSIERFSLFSTFTRPLAQGALNLFVFSPKLISREAYSNSEGCTSMPVVMMPCCTLKDVKSVL